MQPAASVLELPRLGCIATGKPIMPSDHIEDVLAVSPSLCRFRPNWLFRVEDRAMETSACFLVIWAPSVKDARGYLRIAGRLKDMVIRGGMNLYPREIEDVLFGHPAVAQVSVIGVPDERWGEIVAAVILPADPSSALPVLELHNYCRERLSAHKTPTLWFVVEAFPLTPSGKIQKFVLQDQIASGALKPLEWERPVTPKDSDVQASTPS